MTARLRSLQRKMDAVELPKGAVAALCAAILALPAGLAMGHSAKLDSQGRWVHHHTTNYTGCNHIDQDTNLKNEASNARAFWNAAGTPLSFPAWTECHPASGEQVHIQLQDGHHGNTGWRSSAINDSAGFNLGYHVAHTHIHFNLDSYWGAYGNYDRRALVCREIGQVIGVERVWSSQYAAHGADNDCMSFAANPANQVSKVENGNNYTYTDRPGPHSGDLVDQQYSSHAPQLVTDGTLIEAAGSAPFPADGEYDIAATATPGSVDTGAPGITAVELVIDGVLIDSEVSEGSPPCSGSQCSLTLETVIGMDEVGAGQHTVIIRAVDSGTISATESWGITVADPQALPDRLACTSAAEPANFGIFSAGLNAAGHSLTDVIRVCQPPVSGEPVRPNHVSFIYGDCVTSDTDGLENVCLPPVEVQSWPACERALADYESEPGVAYPRTAAGSLPAGAPIYQFDGGARIEVYAASSTIVVLASELSIAEVVLNELRKEDSTYPPGGSPTQAAPGSGLTAPTAGALEGRLQCNGAQGSPPVPLLPADTIEDPLGPYVLETNCTGDPVAPVTSSFTVGEDVPDLLTGNDGWQETPADPHAVGPPDAESPACETSDRQVIEAGPEPVRGLGLTVAGEEGEVAAAVLQADAPCGWRTDNTPQVFQAARREMASALDETRIARSVFWGNSRSFGIEPTCQEGPITWASNGGVVSSVDGGVVAVFDG